MWILPINLHTSHSAQDMLESTKDSDELSQLCEQSLMWRSKPSSAQTWSRRWKRTKWMLLLSGRILKPSRGNSFAEEWASSLEVFHVNPLVAQAHEEEVRIPDTCGQISQKASESSSHQSCSSKMSKESSPQNSKETTGTIQKVHRWLSMSSENWKEWVIAQRREHSARLKSAHRTYGNEPSSWRSPTVNVVGKERNLFEKSGEPWRGEGRPYRMDGFQKTFDLGLQVRAIDGQQEEDNHNIVGSHEEQCPEKDSAGRAWNTPLVNDYKDAGNTRQRSPRKTTGESRKGHCLACVVLAEEEHRNRAWQTPTVRDYKDAGNKKPVKERNDKRKRMDTLAQVALHEEDYRGLLNPRWVETLMGVPVGWCDPFWRGDEQECTSRIDELRMLGNGVVPQTAEIAFATLFSKLLKTESG